jgi:sporulation protein YlmC with PRC-barrel domain
MANLTLDQLSALRGKPVVDAHGEKIGEVDQVYFDEDTSEPKWVDVKRGVFGADHVLVPVEGATVADVELHVPYDKDHIESAPRAEEVKALSPDSDRKLEQHYGVSMSGSGSDTGAADEELIPYMRIVRVWVWPE